MIYGPGSISNPEGVALTRQIPAPESPSWRVLHVIAPGPYGGAESVVTALVAASRRRDAPVGVAALMADPESGRFVAQVRAVDVPVWEIRAGVHGYVTEVRCVRDIVRSEGVGALHTHGYRADAVGYLAARWSGVPVVATAHGFTGGDWKNRAYEWFDRQLLRRFEAVACVSSELMTLVRAGGVRAERVRLIPNAPSAQTPLSRGAARRALGLRPDDRAIGWVGRLSPEKAPERFISAMARVDRPCVGLVVGDGPLRGELEHLALEAGGRVRLAGALQEADRLLPAFDALVLSSRTEGTPMVLLEAMRVEVPVVSFSVGGVPDALGDTGWLAAPGDVAGLAAAITSVLAMPDEAGRRASLARFRVEERYGEVRWLNAYRELYSPAGRRR